MKAKHVKSIMDFINSLRLSIGQYDFDNAVLIGKGRYGNVCEVKSFDDKKIYASKVLKFENSKQNFNANREINIFLSFDHPFIPKVKDVIKNAEDDTCIIMQRGKQSLENIIEQSGTLQFPEKYVTRIIA